MNVKLSLHNAGYCTHQEKISIKDGNFKTIKFPAIYALIEHPTKGYMLVDTGYSSHFMTETKSFPFNIYKNLTPVSFNDGSVPAVDMLKSKGISPNEIKHIIISHFHADHIAGLKDFPNAHFICLKDAYDDISGKKGISALRRAFVPNLLPDNFKERLTLLDRKNMVVVDKDKRPFEVGYDILGDRSLIGVDLTGHAIGQMGIFLSTENEEYLLSADASWSSRAFREFVPPHVIANIIIPKKKSYILNLERLHHLYKNNPNIKIIPSHCSEVWDTYIKNINK
jgi:glyoxylase-like metal-dependent hydrolase (beta-lactamase superfamily II)